MKKFENMYKKYMDNVELSNNELNIIKDNIINKNSKKFIFKPAYITPILICIVAVGLISVSATSIVKHFNVTIEDREGEKEVYKNALSDAKIDLDVTSDILKKDSYYSSDDIENLLGIKILKTKKIKTNMFKLTNLIDKDNKIAVANFWNVNDNKSNVALDDISFAFELNTKYSDKNSELSVVGSTDLENYYIKSLDTEAVIIYSKNTAGPLLSNFVYDNITYSIELDKAFYSVDDLHEILDSFTK